MSTAPAPAEFATESRLNADDGFPYVVNVVCMGTVAADGFNPRRIVCAAWDVDDERFVIVGVATVGEDVPPVGSVVEVACYGTSRRRLYGAFCTGQEPSGVESPYDVTVDALNAALGLS